MYLLVIFENVFLVTDGDWLGLSYTRASDVTRWLQEVPFKNKYP